LPELTPAQKALQQSWLGSLLGSSGQDTPLLA